MYKIIVVEDDDVLREELRALLKNEGYEVETITEYKYTAQKILDCDADLVLLDINISELKQNFRIPVVKLYIKDNGIGIKKSDLSKVFDKSFTGENGRIGAKSTGMGLYIAGNLCNKLGHKITIDSEENEYTQVVITFAQDEYYKAVV